MYEAFSPAQLEEKQNLEELRKPSGHPKEDNIMHMGAGHDRWYQSQGHGFESRECHCEGGIVRGSTI